MARGASSTGKGVRRAAPDRQARVGVQEWVWWGSARAAIFVGCAVVGFSEVKGLLLSSWFWVRQKLLSSLGQQYSLVQCTTKSPECQEILDLAACLAGWLAGWLV